MQVVVHGKHFKEKDLPFAQALLDALHENGINTFIYTPYFEAIKDFVKIPGGFAKLDDFRDFKVHKIDALVSLGGDGTMLNAVTLVRDSGAPMLGINLGEDGFFGLDCQKFDCRRGLENPPRPIFDRRTRPAVHGKHAAHFWRRAVRAERRDHPQTRHLVHDNAAHLHQRRLPQFVLGRRHHHRHADRQHGVLFELRVRIVFPDSKNFVITPVAPHNLNVRPIVVSDDSVISFEIEGRSDNFICTLDSRFELIHADHQLAVRKNDFNVRIIRLHDATFMNTIREKLAWGADVRN